MIGLFAFLALVGVLAGIGFFLSARSAKSQLAARESERAQLASDAEVARKALQDARTEAKARREEAERLRQDLEKSKKKAFEQQESAKRAGGAQALREEIDKLAARLQEARAEAEHQVVRARTLEADLGKANAALERARSRPIEAPPAPAPVAAASPVPTPAPAPDEGALRAEKERADKAEAKLAEARKRVAELERDLKSVRGRLETEKRVYMVQKGELELAADRYAELRRRHDALRKDHDELVEAVRQAAREERRLTEKEAARANAKPASEEPGADAEPAGRSAA
jgi:chromosome segregation ATPase